METKNYIKENYHPQLQGQKLKRTVNNCASFIDIILDTLLVI